MSAKRMRVFAGPNGSGKTTIFKAILKSQQVHLGVYVNADEIERMISTTKSLHFNDHQINVSEEHIQQFFQQSTFSPIKRNEKDLWEKLKVSGNTLYIDTYIDSYLAADLAEFIRQNLLMNDVSFTYETVMSHEGKIEFMSDALKKGYRVYLYFIATEDPEININRVNVRVAQDGHAVTPEIVRSRYYKSLQNLKKAVAKTNRAYLFDNSGVQAEFIAEITEGNDIRLNNAVHLPAWVEKYLLN